MTTAPDLIARYFALAPSADRDAYFGLFAADAVVEDDGRTHRGLEDIRAWRTEVPLVTYTVKSVAPESTADAAGSTAVVEIAGDFPGSPVDLRFAFGFTADGLIEHLAIRP